MLFLAGLDFYWFVDEPPLAKFLMKRYKQTTTVVQEKALTFKSAHNTVVLILKPSFFTYLFNS